MTDLTLHEYKGFSEEELRRILQAEALKICGPEKLVKKNVLFSLSDSGGRRSGTDRRQFSYDIHIPERRRGEDRRSGLDRRSGFDRRKRKELLGSTRLQH
ncbi:MAG: hypothetical protein PVJ69_12045 [Desulfobacteraceae bacterium]|jgi:hypothetical protein